MGIEEFQKDLKNGMGLEEALKKYNLSLKDAFDFVHKPITQPAQKKQYRKRNVYKSVDTNISIRANSYHLRKAINGKMRWGGSYDTIEDAQKVRDFLNEHGWNPIKVNEACKKYGIKRRRR